MAKSHRRERSESRISRRQGKKRSYDRMLIVCEGEKTEVNYFTAIRREKRLPNADIEIVPSDYGTEPLQIVDYALDRFGQSKAFDKVYAVFDRDEHQTYHNALAKADACTNKLKNDEGGVVTFAAVPSVPNFELWILLHFRDILAPIHRTDVYAELKRPAAYPGYEKSSATVYEDTKAHIDVAMQRAASLRARFDKYQGAEPYTDVDMLTVEFLKIAERLG